MDGAGHSLLVSVLSLDAAVVFEAAAVAQLLRRVSEAMVVSVMQEAPAIRSRLPQPGRAVRHAAAGTAGQVQRTTHVSRGVLTGWRRGRRGEASGGLIRVILASIRQRVMIAVGDGFGVIICFFFFLNIKTEF